MKDSPEVQAALDRARTEGRILSDVGFKSFADEANAQADERLDEKAFMADVIKHARQNGWLEYHTYDSRRSRAGFPDLVLVRERVVWVELKNAAGKLQPEQEEWIKALRKAGMEVYVWRPRDWPTIEEVLK